MLDFHTLPGRYLNFGNNFLRKTTTAITTTTRYLCCTNTDVMKWCVNEDSFRRQVHWNFIWLVYISTKVFKWNQLNISLSGNCVAVTMPRKDQNKQLLVSSICLNVVQHFIWPWFSNCVTLPSQCAEWIYKITQNLLYCSSSRTLFVSFNSIILEPFPHASIKHYINQGIQLVRELFMRCDERRLFQHWKW